jgi:hypothetical protein
MFTGCLVTASNAAVLSISVFTASYPRWPSPISPQLPSWTNWLQSRLDSTLVSRLSRNSICSSLYSLGTDRIGNISLNSSHNWTVNWNIAPYLLSLPCRMHLSTNCVAPVVFLVISLHGPNKKHRFSTVTLLLSECSLPRELVYRSVA